MSYTRAQLDTGTLAWALTLTIRGRVYRFAEGALEVDDAGESLHFHPGLGEVVYTDRIGLPGEGVDDPAQEIEVFFSDDTAAGWAALAAGDLDLGDASGELALILVGEGWETREVLLAGTLEATRYGALYEPVGLLLSESPWRPSPRRFPPDSEGVTPDTWPRAASVGYSVDEGVYGVRYPEVVGAPGFRLPRDTATSYPAVPVALVEVQGANNSVDDFVGLIGRGVLACVGVSDSVRVRNLTQGFGGDFTPTAALDALGQAVTVVTIPVATLAVDVGDELWVSFLIPGQGGRMGPWGGTLRHAGDVLALYLIESGARVDSLALDAARRWLNGFEIDGYFNEQVDLVDVALDDLLPLLPVALHVGPRGLELIPWRYDATLADAVDHLDVDLEGGERDGDVERSPGAEVVNHQAVEYAWSDATGDYHGRLAYIPSQRFADSELQRNPYARASYTRYGEREGVAIQTDLVLDTATARGILDWRIRWWSQTRETVAFWLPQGRQALRCGGVVSVTCAEISWSRKVCKVTATDRTPGRARIEVVTLPDWVRDGT
mgnify:FL=1